MLWVLGWVVGVVGVGLGLGLGWVGLGWEDYCKVLSQRQSAANHPDPTSTSSIGRLHALTAPLRYL